MPSRRAPKERQINTFKKPFDFENTPYKLEDFHNLVKEFCKKTRSELKLKIAKTIFIGDMGVGKTSLINRAMKTVPPVYRYLSYTEEFLFLAIIGCVSCLFILVNGFLTYRRWKKQPISRRLSDLNSTLCRFREKNFLVNNKSTVGVDCFLEGFDVLGVPFNIQIWDTAGQERFRCIASPYFRGTTVIVLVFDLTNIDSLHHCEEWLDIALEATQLKETPYIVLVGNKLDDIDNTGYCDVKKQAVNLANKMGAEYWVVSSKTGENVEHFFRRLAVLAFEWLVLNDYRKQDVDIIMLSKELSNSEKKKNCAC